MADAPLRLSFTLDGPPRTKKNHGRRIWRKNKKTGKKQPYHVPSLAHDLWFEKASWQMRQIIAAASWRALDVGVHVKALFFREANVGDQNGYTQALGDLLERAGVIKNDRLIVSWDGTRLLKDAERPRIEVIVEPMPGERDGA